MAAAAAAADCFSELSYKITKIISKNEKQENGIYFTPPKTITRCINLLSAAAAPFNNILEPSCGSCEFIEKIKVCYPDATITGIEYNKNIYDNIKDIYNIYNNNAKIKIIEGDFLKTDFADALKFDLIIGNPPYYVMKKTDVKSEYYDYFDGRPNIFLLFIIKSLTLLTDEGILCFILPKSFLNCLYYNKTRKYIYDNYLILSILECDDKYIDTEQPTIIFIIRKKAGGATNAKYILGHLTNEYTILSTSEVIERLNGLYVGATTLKALQFKVSVGSIVWNQHKAALTDDPQKTRLIYSQDIKDNTLSIKEYTNTAKKNYINKSGFNEPLLVVNRGYGVGNYNFEYALINCDEQEAIKEYLIENHLICIRCEAPETAATAATAAVAVDKYNKIYKSFGDERTLEFIKLYFGNNAINTTELLNILPIYI
jgi:SAM-dependent methyltransferase